MIYWVIDSLIYWFNYLFIYWFIDFQYNFFYFLYSERDCILIISPLFLNYKCTKHFGREHANENKHKKQKYWYINQSWPDKAVKGIVFHGLYKLQLYQWRVTWHDFINTNLKELSLCHKLWFSNLWNQMLQTIDISNYEFCWIK